MLTVSVTLNPWIIQLSHTHTELLCNILMNFIEKCFCESAAGAHFSAKFFSCLLSPCDSPLFIYYFLPWSLHNYWPPNANAEF